MVTGKVHKGEIDTSGEETVLYALRAIMSCGANDIPLRDKVLRNEA